MKWGYSEMNTRTPFFYLFAVLASLASVQADELTPHRKLEESLVIGSALADIATTEYFLRNNPALAEGNPLAQSTATRVGIKTGATVGILMLARHFDRRGAHKTARVIRWTTISMWSGAAGWNLHLGLTIPMDGE